MAAEASSEAGWVALRHRPYRFYWVARVLVRLALEMQITAVSWQVYELTGRALFLGLVGLAQFGPFLILFPLSGTAADRLSRKRILLGAVFVQTLCATGFFLLTFSGKASFPAIFAILVALGITRAFQAPSLQAIVPLLVPMEHFGNAVAWTAIGMQTARIAGPAIAGALLILGIQIVYGVVVVLFIASMTLTALIITGGQLITTDRSSLRTVLAGFGFIWSRPVVLGAITLDLFAVLLGGATALLPIFAVDILGVGELGFGALRAAHVVGSLSGALVLTQRPVTRRAGAKLLGAVAIFGGATCVFGASTAFWLSFAALFVLGAADAVSVFVRNNLVQIITPDDMRGRVSAVNSVFIGASNELGEFESGITAAWWGAVPAVLVGGLGTIMVALLAMRLFPDLRGLDTLDPDVLVREHRDVERK